MAAAQLLTAACVYGMREYESMLVETASRLNVTDA